MTIPSEFDIVQEVAKESKLRVRVGAMLIGPEQQLMPEQVAHGWNKRIEHPYILRYGYPEWSTMHAELAALLDADWLVCGGTMYVMRLLRNGDWGLAKPCTHCMTALVECGVSEVWYTLEPGKVAHMRLGR